MTIVICLDKNYWYSSQILFRSLKKNWNGRVCVLCVDFKPIIPDELSYIEYNTCSLQEFRSYREDWPSNRDFYFCSESGEFLDYFYFEPDELIIHLDADMIMQREMSAVEKQQLEHIEQREIAMSPSTYPVATLREELFRINPKRSYKKINNDYPGILGEIPLYCCGMVIARADTYRKLRVKYIDDIDKMIYNFNHHAASQWIFNYIARQNFNVLKLSNVFSNASWYIDTRAEERDERLVTDGQIVLFNHTKFIKDYKY